MNLIRKNRPLFIITFCLFFFLLFFVLISFTQAASAPATAPIVTPKFTPLVGIPGLSNKEISSLPAYINQVYILIITIGALFGVVKIAIAGVKYSMSDVVTDKSSAREDIKGVLLGLAILLLPFVVLSTINPDLTNLDVLSGSQKVKINETTGLRDPMVRAQIINTTKSTCESVPGNTWIVVPPDSGKCSGPTPGLKLYTYYHETEKSAAIKKCEDISGTAVDKPAVVSPTSGVIECTFQSNVLQIPI